MKVPDIYKTIAWCCNDISEAEICEMCPFGAGSLKISFEGERRVILVAYDEVYKYLVDKGGHAHFTAGNQCVGRVQAVLDFVSSSTDSVVSGMLAAGVQVFFAEVPVASLLYTPPGFITVERGFGGECFGLRHLCLAGFEGATLDFIDHFVTDTDWKLAISASQKNSINNLFKIEYFFCIEPWGRGVIGGCGNV